MVKLQSGFIFSFSPLLAIKNKLHHLFIYFLINSKYNHIVQVSKLSCVSSHDVRLKFASCTLNIQTSACRFFLHF